VNGSIYALHAEIIDEHGQRLSNDLLHHMNVMNPSERESSFRSRAGFSRQGGRKRAEIRFPWLLFGSPIRAGERILAMHVHNPTAENYHGVHVRLVLSYVPDHRPWPFFAVIPWQLECRIPGG